MRCLMFTKRLSRETTTTCSSDREQDCRDRLCSKPNSHSGNAVAKRCQGSSFAVSLSFTFTKKRPRLPLRSVHNNSSLHSSSNQKCTLWFKSLEHPVQAAQVSPNKKWVSLLAPPSPPGCSVLDHMGPAGHRPKLLLCIRALRAPRQSVCTGRALSSEQTFRLRIRTKAAQGTNDWDLFLFFLLKEQL